MTSRFLHHRHSIRSSEHRLLHYESPDDRVDHVTVAPKGITVARMISLQEAADLYEKARGVTLGSIKFLDSQTRNLLAIALITEDIGIEGHNYGHGPAVVRSVQ